MVDILFYSLFSFYRKGIFLSLLIQTESICRLFLLSIIYSSLLSDHNHTDLRICLLSLLYHYIFFKHSLCIAIHLSIFLLYHYILISTKCHITDSCIIISPFPLYSTCILVFHFKHREWTLSLLYHYILIKQRCYVY